MNEEQMKHVANLISQDIEKDKEIERLHSIIEEAREYINIHLDIDNETGGYHLKHIFDSSNLYKLLKILDKVNK